MAHEGFRQFVELRYGELLRTAFLLTGTAYAAEDPVQTGLLNAWRHWDRIDEPMSYVWRAMVNQRNNIWRRIASWELITGMLPEQSAPDPAAGFAERAELLAALARLPRRMRAVLVLRYWEDLSEVDTAALLGCSVGTAIDQLRRLGKLDSAWRCAAKRRRRLPALADLHPGGGGASHSACP